VGILEGDIISEVLLPVATSPYAAGRELVEWPVWAHTSGAYGRAYDGLVGVRKRECDMESANYACAGSTPFPTMV
jgi:hypothetical protein